jgi:hypothetical protein
LAYHRRCRDCPYRSRGEPQVGCSRYLHAYTPRTNKRTGRRKIIIVNDKMQHGYRYALSERPGRNVDPNFRPELTPKEMLELSVFGGKSMTDCRKEFPPTRR